MAALKAHVRNGQLVVDQPTDLPEGSEVDLLPVDGWDDLNESDRRLLHEALAASEEDLSAGRVRPVEEVLADLQRRP
jgi:hypothetical protein